MKLNQRTDAIRARSDLYCIEAERIESQNIADADTSGCRRSLQAGLRTVQSDRGAIDQEIRTMVKRPERGGISQETAWKILTITFAVAGLAGFLAATWSPPSPQVTSTVEPLRLPVSYSSPNTSEIKASSVLEASTASISPDAPEKNASRAAARSEKERRCVNGIRGKTVRAKTSKPRGSKPKPPNDDLGFFDDCGMDPMCGFEKRPKK